MTKVVIAMLSSDWCVVVSFGGDGVNVYLLQFCLFVAGVLFSGGGG